MKRTKLTIALIVTLWICFVFVAALLIVQITQKSNGIQGPQGPTGAQGTQGEQGPAGERGSYWYSGNGQPTSTNPTNAKDGDMYLDLETMDVYSYNGSAWAKLGTIKGDDGERGTKWFRGTDAPTNSDQLANAQEGDFYFMYFEDTSLLTGYVIYVHNGEEWQVVADMSTARNLSQAEQYSVKGPIELAALAQLVNQGESFQNITIMLTDDIDLDGAAWTPIGKNNNSSNTYSGTPFKGTFDGNNKTISNLSIYSSGYDLSGESESIKYYAGLFGKLQNATVKNLTIKGAQVGLAPQYESGTRNVAPQYTGILAGRIETSEISNVHLEECNIRVSQHGGIFAGEAWTGTVSYCSLTKCSINGNTGAFVGGFSAQGYATYSNCTVDGCTIQGGMKTGGIVGQSDEGNYNMTDVTVKNSTLMLMNNYGAGMLIGLLNYGNQTFENCVVENCSIREERSQNTKMYDVGGFVGRIIAKEGNVKTFKDCRVDGISFTNYVAVYDVGGFVGGQQDSASNHFTIKFEDCSVNNMTVTSGTDDITAVGVFVGKLNSVGANVTVEFAEDGNTYGKCGDYAVVGDDTHNVVGQPRKDD